ncbi:MAG TPA: alpha/beta hydrolase, partial [Candidatus Binatia bacterium]|nr:alpha/beta hydrolase [Candidatus Binatia bacterium]
PDQSDALEMFPDGKGEIEDEVRRYQMLRLSSRIGFKPPYFYNYALRNRLHRVSSPTQIIWGEHDRFVPRSHGETYAKLIPHAGMESVAGAGHSVPVEKPQETAQLILDFLSA